MVEVLQVKNMVCPRCVMAVESLLSELAVDYDSVILGQVSLKEELGDDVRRLLTSRLEQIGFEVIVDKRIAMVEQVKTIIIDLIYKNENQLKVNLSDYLHDLLDLDYNYISKQFSEVEHQTIERFVLATKAERVKELLSYNELTLTEIADLLHYSSVAHLSTQFKRVTGLTPTQYKANSDHPRNSISSN